MLKKSLLALGLLISISGSMNAEIYYPELIANAGQAQSHPHKEIAWDIHNVLAQKESSWFGKKFAGVTSYLGAIKQAPKAFASALYSLAYSKITGKSTPITRAQNDMKELPKAVRSAGEAYMEIFEKRGLSGLALITQTASNAYIPRPGMAQLVNAIHNKGITQRYATNTGARLFAALKEKFQTTYDSYFLDLLAPGKMVDYSDYGARPNVELQSHVTKARKPSADYFMDFNRTYNPDNKSLIIFIDEKEENVKAATAYGWVGIHFDITKADHLAILENDLKALGVIK